MCNFLVTFAGIVVKRFNFSEAQAGKSYCDAKIAHLRKKMRLYVADGNDIKFPADMKMAIDTSGGVAGCQVAVVNVDYPINCYLATNGGMYVSSPILKWILP